MRQDTLQRIRNGSANEDLSPYIIDLRSPPVRKIWETDRIETRRAASPAPPKKPYSLFAKCFAEFIGVLSFVFAGTMQANVYVARSTDGLTHAALNAGFALFVLGTVFGHISGAHFNPSVSWAVALTGKLPIAHLPLYIASQLLGGFCGAVLSATEIIKSQLVATGCGATILSSDHQWWEGLIAETIATFLLVNVVLMVAVDTDTILVAPLAIALMASVDVFAISNIVAEIFVAHDELPPGFWGHHYIYWAGPFLGATIAVGVYRLFEAREVRLVP
ncbi:unnamed protein product [Caenorhabditis auriculariae]|uniref:Uncharacterized protein n=1 Tax=Caenorhabditis auriculariae TaxID=2777116 RepID=A0A8S1HS81_9PELO|nr:unnamed protein product [Caenorhabditis auriculariae]